MATPITVERSRAIPVDVPYAFDSTRPMPLPVLVCRRYALVPPITQVRGQIGSWGQVGQTRTVVTSDGGTMREALTDVDPPRSFSYRLSEITGPMGPLVDSIDGRWEFTSKGTGTLITWRWTLDPRGLGAPVMPLITAMWLRYASRALERLSELLLDPEPA